MEMNLESIDFSGMSQDELKKVAARSLSRIKDREGGIGRELFDAIITVVPQTCIEAIVVDNIEKTSKILVTWRDDKHYHGWHFPGGYIRFGKDFDETVHNVIQKELGVGIKRLKDTGVKYGGVDSRGHTLGIVFLVELDSNPSKGEWFDKVPSELLNHHKEFLEKVLGLK